MCNSAFNWATLEIKPRKFWDWLKCNRVPPTHCFGFACRRRRRLLLPLEPRRERPHPSLRREIQISATSGREGEREGGASFQHHKRRGNGLRLLIEHLACHYCNKNQQVSNYLHLQQLQARYVSSVQAMLNWASVKLLVLNFIPSFQFCSIGRVFSSSLRGFVPDRFDMSVEGKPFSLIGYVKWSLSSLRASIRGRGWKGVKSGRPFPCSSRGRRRYIFAIILPRRPGGRILDPGCVGGPTTEMSGWFHCLLACRYAEEEVDRVVDRPVAKGLLDGRRRRRKNPFDREMTSTYQGKHCCGREHFPPL